VVGGLTATGYVTAFTAVGLALTTTALGTVLPIMREKGMLGGALARYFLATGAIGELFPILAIAIFLSVNSRFSALISLAAIALVAAVLAVFPRFVHGGRLANIALEGADATSQTTLRLTILLLLGLLVLAGEFGLDVVLGAFLAGAVLRRWAPGDVHALESKLDAIGYGFFIPVFFVTAGMGIDLQSIRESPDRLVVFFILLLAVRGLPMLVVYRRALPARERVQLMLLGSTTLPLVVALTEIGLSTGTMLPENAAALVGAGVLSVLFFPLIATAINRSAPTSAEQAQPPEASSRGSSSTDAEHGGR
jgi:Kef-type K+ transport system membrane component KefB